LSSQSSRTPLDVEAAVKPAGAAGAASGMVTAAGSLGSDALPALSTATARY
jgi:hypothetical protein